MDSNFLGLVNVLVRGVSLGYPDLFFDLVGGHGGVMVAQAIVTVDLHWGLHCQGLSLLTATEVTA